MAPTPHFYYAATVIARFDGSRCVLSLEDPLETETVRSTLETVRLGQFAARLDEEGHWGQTLSLGEQQRLALGRALLAKPDWLFLDEATSAVDTETEREIQLALDNLIQGRTTLAIAHRLSTLRKADRLVVLERGRIVEIGKHSELLEAEGAYSRLHKAQMELAQGIGI